MFIRVQLPNEEEGLFNGDCTVAYLLDSIKKRHQLSREENIDLSSTEGQVKQLHSHLTENGTPFFKLRELCVVIRVLDTGGPVPTYEPALSEYSRNEEFIATLNSGADSRPSRARAKRHQPVPPLSHTGTGNSSSSAKSPTPELKGKAPAGSRKRHPGKGTK